MHTSFSGVQGALMQVKISEMSVRGSEHLSFSLSYLKTLRMLVDHFRENGPDEHLVHIAEDQIQAVEKIDHWLNTEREYMLDFVIDLQAVIKKLLTAIQKEMRFFIS